MTKNIFHNNFIQKHDSTKKLVFLISHRLSQYIYFGSKLAQNLTRFYKVSFYDFLMMFIIICFDDQGQN